jgi:hypothetical protein
MMIRYQKRNESTTTWVVLQTLAIFGKTMQGNSNRMGWTLVGYNVYFRQIHVSVPCFLNFIMAFDDMMLEILQELSTMILVSISQGPIVSSPSHDLLQVGANQGANQACYKQFQGSKEFGGFLRKFWDMRKSDQDSMVPGSIFISFVWFQLRFPLVCVYENIHSRPQL